MDMRIRPTMPGLSIKTWAYFVNKGLNKPIIKMQHGKYLFFWIRVVSNIDLNLPPVLYFYLCPNRLLATCATESDFSD